MENEKKAWQTPELQEMGRRRSKAGVHMEAENKPARIVGPVL